MDGAELRGDDNLKRRIAACQAYTDYVVEVELDVVCLVIMILKGSRQSFNKYSMRYYTYADSEGLSVLGKFVSPSAEDDTTNRFCFTGHSLDLHAQVVEVFLEFLDTWVILA